MYQKKRRARRDFWSLNIVFRGRFRRRCLTPLRTVPSFVTAHTFCTSGDTRVSYGLCLLIQGYFCAV